MADPAQRRNLDEIEQQIASHRASYLRCMWAGREMEAEFHEGEVDRLLDRWDAIRTGRKAIR